MKLGSDEYNTTSRPTFATRLFYMSITIFRIIACTITYGYIELTFEFEWREVFVMEPRKRTIPFIVAAARVLQLTS